MVAAAGAFTALDLGAWTDEHGDHGHSFTADPRLTDFTVPAEEPGHVVPHAGRTTLFDDGTGTVTAFDPHDLEDLEDDAPALDTWQLARGPPRRGRPGRPRQPRGTPSATTTPAPASGSPRPPAPSLAVSGACPGVHGEAFAGDVAVFGCEDGVLVVDGREIRKVTSPDPYGRIGNQAGHESSPYVLGDYKTDPDAELERPTRVSLIDTRERDGAAGGPAGRAYTFRSLGRTPDGDGLVLGTDGALHVVDARTRPSRAVHPGDGRPGRSRPSWREPRPTLQVAGDTAYVTEPATRELHVVDLATMETTATHRLDVVPDELVAVTGVTLPRRSLGWRHEHAHRRPARVSIAPLVLMPGDPLRRAVDRRDLPRRRAVLHRGARDVRLHRHLARAAGLGAGLGHGAAVAGHLRPRAVHASTTCSGSAGSDRAAR